MGTRMTRIYFVRIMYGWICADLVFTKSKLKRRGRWSRFTRSSSRRGEIQGNADDADLFCL